MTLYLLAERIYRIYSGGDPSDDAGIKLEDVKHLVVDQINRMLKIEALSVNFKLGDNTPTNLVLATYNKVPVTQYNTVLSRAELPAIPVSLPNGLGVWFIAPDASDQTIHDQFVPMRPGDWSLMKDAPFSGDGTILGNNTYEVNGKYIIFHKDISNDVPDVVIKLVVTDIKELGDFDLLPIPADYADDVVKEVLRILGVVPKVTDQTNDNNPQV